jgi:hypothetical protein
MSETQEKKQYKRNLLASVAIAIALGLTGCVTTQILPKAPEDRVPSDKALIVVDGSPSFGGIFKLYAVKLYDNKTLVGNIAPHGKMVWLREPGPMDITINKFVGKRLNVVAGERYHYKIECNSDLLYSIAGRGIPINMETMGQSPEDALIMFRVLPNQTSGIIRLANIKTGKLFAITLNPSEHAWRTLYLPIGEYNFLSHESRSWNGYATITSVSQINAEFAVTQAKAGVYVGDIKITKGGFSILKDSPAARAFLEQNSHGVPYTESIMKINQ